jgi:hypothetical protein
LIKKQPLILATGLQSGGTTVVSHAFLKHSQVDGILDMASDKIEMNFARVTLPIVWVKMTSIAFRWEEVAEIYRLQGYEVYPLLIVRNPFDAWSSLKNKWYGLNSVTAEDPPLILRFRRFLQDWMLFTNKGWPIIKFENFIADPTRTIQKACTQLPIEFESSMLSLDNEQDIAYVNETNESFETNKSKGIVNDVAHRVGELSHCEVNWISASFSVFNDSYGYLNRHIVVDEPTSLLPQPYDNRRSLGFGTQAFRHKVSSQIPYLLKRCEEATAKNQPIIIYGNCELGEYLISVLQRENIKQLVIMDSFAITGDQLLGYDVLSPACLSEVIDGLFVIASFKNSQLIAKKILESADIAQSQLFIFGDQ